MLAERHLDLDLDLDAVDLDVDSVEEETVAY
jgi:hypothetical protein